MGSPIPPELLDAAFGGVKTPKFGAGDSTLTTPAAKNNNPGNLRGAGGWRKFASAEEGFQALVDDIGAKQTGRTTTGLGPHSSLGEFFGKYAPPNENDTAKYAATVAKRLGVTVDTPIGGLDRVALAKEIAAFEDRKYWDSINLPEVREGTPPDTVPTALLDAAFGTKEQKRAQTLVETLSQVGTQPADASNQRLRPLDKDEVLSGMRKAPGERRVEFMERSAPARKLLADLDAVNTPSTIGPAPKGWGKVSGTLANLRLMDGSSLLTSRSSEGGIAIGGAFRFANQLLTPTVGELAKGNVAKSFENFYKIGGALAEGIADPFVTMPANLMLDYLHGSDVLLPEERTSYLKTTLANYAGIFLGLEAGAAFEMGSSAILTAGRRSLMDVPMSELAALSRTSIRSKLAKGAVEGVVGGAVVGFVDPPQGEDREDMAVAFALMAAPLGVAFEVLRNAKRIGFGERVHEPSVADAAGELFRLKQYQAVKDADAAIMAMKETAESGDITIPIVDPPAEPPPPPPLDLDWANHTLKYDVGGEEPLTVKFSIDPEDPTIGKVEWVGGSQEGLHNVSMDVGPKKLREILADVRQKFPQITHLTGTRISGARNKGRAEWNARMAAGEIVNPMPNATVTVELPPLPNQLVSFAGKDYAFKGTDAKGNSVIEDNHGVEHTVPATQALPTVETNVVAAGETRTADGLYRQFRREQLSTTPPSLRQGELGAAGAHFSEPGRSTYYDPENPNAKAYRYPDARIADVTDLPTRTALLTEALKDPRNSTQDVEILTHLLQSEDYLDYMAVEELELSKAAKNLGYDGIRFFEGDDVDVPTTVNIWNLDKVKEVPNIFHEADWTLHDSALSPDSKPLSIHVAEFAARHNIPADQVEAFSRFFADKLGEDARKQSLTPEENALYNRMVRDNQSASSDPSNYNLVDLATSSGLYVEHHGGGVTLRDVGTDNVVVRVSSPARAKEFLMAAGAGVGPNLDVGGPIPPAGVVRGVSTTPPPPNGPQGSEYNFREDGPLRQFTHWMNNTWVGLHTTRMRQIMISLDAQLGTRMFAEIWEPLNRVFTQRNAFMHPDVKRLAGHARMAKSFTPEEYEHATAAMETMSADDRAKPKSGTGLDAVGMLERGMNARELEGSAWFSNHGIDIRKAYGYRRALKNLERSFGSSPEELANATTQLKKVMGIDANHEEAARIIDTVAKGDRNELSIVAITSHAQAKMHGELSVRDYITANKLSPLVVKFVELMREQYNDLGKKGDIPEEAMLGAYFPHYKNYAEDVAITSKDGIPVFVSDLLRTGELSEYDRDPISTMYRYITTLANKKHVNAAWENALSYLNEATAGMGDNGATIKDLVRKNYMDKIRGIPADNTKLSQRLFDGFLARLGINVGVDTKRDLTNTVLSLSSAAVMGARVSQGARDVSNIISIFYSRFGAARAGSMLRIVSKYTPQMLKEEGIILDVVPGEGVAKSLQREGVSPTLSPIAVQSAEERAQADIAMRTQASSTRDFISRMADAGIKWGGQHTAYQWGHAAAYLEGRHFTSEVLTEMMRSALEPEKAKAAAYKKLKIDTYDLPVSKEFDRLVKSGNFSAAADFMGHANAYETVSIFGYGDSPVGWDTNGGRLFAQLGSWSVWSRSQIGRLMSRGSAKERIAATTRFAMTQTATKLASTAMGLNLNSWYLPFAAPLFGATASLSEAANEYDTEKQLELVKNAMIQSTFGLAGSGLFAGGPAASMGQAAVTLGRNSEDRAALRSLGRSWMLGVPFSFFIQDMMEANKMAQQGVNPINTIARLFGTRSNEEPSALNPYGIPR